MRIWIDGQCFQTASRDRGIGRYVFDLLDEITRLERDVEIHVSLNAAMSGEAVVGRHVLRGLIPDRNIHVWQSMVSQGECPEGYSEVRQQSEIILAHHINTIAPDIVFGVSPFEGMYDFAVPLNPALLSGFPVAQIYYDPIPDKFPHRYLSERQAFAAHQRRKDSYTHCDMIFAISNFTTREAQENWPEVECIPIFAGIGEGLIAAQQELRHEIRCVETDLLYVGGLDWRKNVVTVIKALALLKSEKGRDVHFDIAGAYDSLGAAELSDAWRKAGLRPDYLRLHGRESDIALLRHYRNARLVIQPSLMEGFGLTALEGAFADSCVIGSRGSALAEIIADDRAMFDPLNEREMSSVIETFLDHPETREAVKQVQKGCIERYTWNKTARSTMEGLRRLYGSKPAGERAGSLDEMRSRTLSIIDATAPGSRAQLARCLAASEVQTAANPARLLIDATSTIRADHQSGIQRVVKKIVQNMPSATADRELPFSIVYCDDDAGLFDQGRDISPAAKDADKRLVMQSQETILLLDSSWEYQHHHRLHLMDARLKGCDVISCLYDMVPLRHHAFCDPGMPVAFTRWFEMALTYSSAFICISKAVADELHGVLEAIEFPREMRIGYWPLGADFANASDGPAPAGTGGAQAGSGSQIERPPLFLMVGTLEPRKGHRVALHAFEELWKDGSDAQLVIVGKQGWGVVDLMRRLESHPENGRRLHLKSFVSDEELRDLYLDCDALLACSYAEGFGLPIVEAGYYGKPVIASDIPVFREVAVSAPQAHFFKVGSSPDLAHALRSFLANESGASEKPEIWPTWEQSAAKLIDALCDGPWYRHYRPANAKRFPDFSDLGNVRLSAPLPEIDTLNELAYVEGPYESDDVSELVLIVGVTNMSAAVWSSKVTNVNDRPVKLGYRLLDEAGEALATEFPRTEIPFVLVPGATHHMPIRFGKRWLAKGAKQIEVRLVQEGVAWWKGAIRIPI